MKIVLDANIFVSFFLTKNPTIAKIFHLWQEKKLQILVSPEIKSEILKVFQYPKIKKNLRTEDYQALNYLLQEETRLIVPKKRITLCKDLEDNMYLECTLEAKANYLITGDKKHLLPLKKFHQTKIVSPNKFLKHLNI